MASIFSSERVRLVWSGARGAGDKDFHKAVIESLENGEMPNTMRALFGHDPQSTKKTATASFLSSSKLVRVFHRRRLGRAI